GRDTLPAATRAELRRVLPKGGTVDLVGSVDVTGDGVRAAVRGLGYKVRRYGGATPAAVARTIARRLAATTTVTAVFEVSQRDPAAAWAASPAAAAAHGVILLTDGARQSAETAGWLAQHPEVKTRYAVGAAAAKADPAATPVVGPDAAGTATAVARKFFAQPSRAAVVGRGSGLAGLVAAARLGQTRGPLLVAYPATLPAGAASYVADKHGSLRRVDLVGGRLPYDAVESGLQRALLR
ncbi:MAG: hypothetical protein QOJ03_2710, partial [Frankiaceae bacterium]|nr:hypothetical protein [Frankiaceae bacterium]